MAVGAAGERYGPAVRPDEARRRIAFERLADAGDPDADGRRFRLEGGRGSRRNGREDFIIVAAGRRNREEVGIGGDRGARGERQRQPVDQRRAR